jgi:phosphoglycolate phosphatase-like HAD superfamily hydrolase
MKLFVWDLHGTLEQGNEKAVIELSNMALQQLGYRERFLPEDARTLYGLKWYQYFEHLLPDEPHEQHLALQEASFAISEANHELIMQYMRPSAHALEVLQAITDAGHRQILISNTVPATVPRFIRALGMEQHFTPANSFAVNAHSKYAMATKESALQAYLGRVQKPFAQLIVIGDSATDLALAEAVGATSFLYAHPGYAFRTEGGTQRINDLRAVLQAL